jgi:hypothetical protein
MGLGLSKVNAQVYIFLANAGPQSIERMVDELKLEEAVLQRCLQVLRRRRIVFSHERHVSFHALPFDEALKLLAKEQLKQLADVEQKRSEILSKWQKMIAGSKS